MERDWPHYSFMVLFKSYLSCYLNPESLLWFAFACSFLYRLTQQSERGRHPRWPCPGNPFSLLSLVHVCLSSSWLNADVCCVLFHLGDQGQRQLDMPCGHGVDPTFLARQEGVVSDNPESASDMDCGLSQAPLWVCQNGPMQSTEKNARCPSKRDFEGLTKEKWLLLQNRDLNLASVALSPPPNLSSMQCPTLAPRPRKAGHSRPGCLSFQQYLYGPHSAGPPYPLKGNLPTAKNNIFSRSIWKSIF